MLKALIFSILSILPISLANALEIVITWNPVTPQYPHYVKCDGERLNQEGIFDAVYEFDAPNGFRKSCSVEACSGSECAETHKVYIHVATPIEYIVADNWRGDTRPVYDIHMLLEGNKEKIGDVATGTPCGKFVIERGWYTYHEVAEGAAVCEAKQ